MVTIYALCFATIFRTEEANLKIGYARVSTNDQSLDNQIGLCRKKFNCCQTSRSVKANCRVKRMLPRNGDDDNYPATKTVERDAKLQP